MLYRMDVEVIRHPLQRGHKQEWERRMSVFTVITDAGTLTLVNEHCPGDPGSGGPERDLEPGAEGDSGDRQIRYLAAVRREYEAHSLSHPTLLVGDWNFVSLPGDRRDPTP
jgi:hypothetical protein